jgi:Cu(I)/Ag(I) efflux system membrane fusion protein
MEPLRKGTEMITGAQDIEAMREAFELLSVGMIDSVEHLGVEIKGPLFELYCSMAFNNKGATWLQQDEDIRNPYFGAQMLKCGEVKRQLKGERS